MDQIICLWEASGVKCDKIKAHNGSISKIEVDSQGIGITAGYDHLMYIWDFCGKKPKVLEQIGVHTQPITTFSWKNSLLVSGDR